MSLYLALKTAHILCAFLSIAGFALRGFWMMTGNRRLRSRYSRVLPHILDSVLLGTALGMVWIWGVSPLEHAWLTAKLAALLAYISLGMVALRLGRTRSVRVLAYVLALSTAGYMLSVAFTKNPMGPLLIF